MSVTNERRHALYKRFEDVLGEEEATTIMDYLPPVGWADVATTSDLRQMATELRGEMTVGFADMRSEMHKGQRDIIFAMIASNVSIAGLAIAVSQLL